jgi:hypothetical protein
VELLPHGRIAVGPQFLLVGREQDGMPGGDAPEGLRIAHGKARHITIGRAQRIGANPGFGRFVHQRHVLLPGLRLPHRLPQVVIDQLAATRLSQACHQAVVQLRIPPAATLDGADAEFAEDIRERKHLGFLRPERRNMDPLRIVMPPIFRHRQPQRPVLQALADNAAHRVDLLRRGGTALALVAHDVIAHGRMADEVPHVHPKLLVEGGHVLPDRFPAHIDGVQHLHGNGFHVGKKLGQPGRLAGADRRQRQRAIADDDGGGAVVAGEGAQRVPGHLRIIVAVIIDEAGGDHQAIGINGARRRIPEFADRDNLAVGDPDIAAEGGHAGAIDDAPVLD